MSLAGIWLIWAAIGTSAIGALLVWAARTGQFSQFDRQSNLPLKDRDIGGGNRAASGLDRAALVALPAVAFVMVLVMIWTGFRNS